MVNPFRLSEKQLHWLEFLLVMSEKEVKARYKNAIFGFLWILLNPVLQMLVMGMVFQFFIPVKVDNYFFFLFSGLLPWIFFSYTVQKNTQAFIFERGLIQKAAFPRESIVLSVVMANFFNLLISFLVFTVLLGFFGMLTWKIILLPFVLIWILALTSSCSLLFSALTVKYRDITFFVQAGMPLVFYATPIVYQITLLPAKYEWVFYVNPLASLMEVFHWMLVSTELPSRETFLINAGITLVLCIVSWSYFSRESKYFTDWL